MFQEVVVKRNGDQSCHEIVNSASYFLTIRFYVHNVDVLCKCELFYASWWLTICDNVIQIFESCSDNYCINN